jgi:hypothetical protein
MEDGSKIGDIDETDAAVDDRKQIPDALSIALAHNRVVKGKAQGGQANAESIIELARLVADAPEHIVHALFPNKGTIVEL